jgi:KipI family sensor histidine kinase inhibitor
MTDIGYRFIPFGDTGLVVEFGDRIDRGVSTRVLQLDRRIRAIRLPGVIEATPTFRSLLITFDPLSTDHDALMAALPTYLEDDAPMSESAAVAKIWTFPVRYGGEEGPDLEGLSDEIGISGDSIIEIHQQTLHHVYMLGFLPGAPYLGDLPPNLNVPRLRAPRVAVPAGSVAIALGLTVIYPVQSPGGWRIIGKTPVPLFDVHQETPALLSPGDAIRFEAVSASTLKKVDKAAKAGAWSPKWELRENA